MHTIERNLIDKSLNYIKFDKITAMSKTKQGKFSNYQFSKTILQNPSGGWKTERSSTEMGSNIHEFSQLESFREKTAKINRDCAEKLQSAR